MQNAKCKMQILEPRYFAICNLQFAICNSNRRCAQRQLRTGGIYIVVLGTSMIVAVLGLSALMVQRIQNRMLTASSDIRQAQLNAHAAVELALLTTRGNDNWRSGLAADSFLFTDKSMAAGSTCSMKITDAAADPTTAVADRPITLLGIGTHGATTGNAPRTPASQRVELTVDPRRQPHDCLKQGSTAQPDWNTVFAYYQAQATPIDFDQLPAAADMPNMGRNPGIESNVLSINDPNWTGAPPGIPVADVDESNNWKHSGNFGLRVRDRTDWKAGAAQTIDAYVKPGQQYYVEVWVNVTSLLAARTFRVTLYAKGSGDATALADIGPDGTVLSVVGFGVPVKISGTVTAPEWTGNLEYAFVKIAGADSSNTGDFYMDDFLIRDNSSGRFIYKQALGPGFNPLYASAPTNANGLYWINCGNQDLILERSRIRGTLLVLNPGPNSRIDYGPIHLSPHIPGYPTLLVSGNLSIRATNTLLSEATNGCNYNPPGAVNTPGVVHRTLGTDGDMVDVYNDSGINGLVVVSGNLTYKYSPQLRGRVIVGGSIINNGSPSITYLPDSLLNPPPPLGVFYTYRYDRRPASTRKAVQ